MAPACSWDLEMCLLPGLTPCSTWLLAPPVGHTGHSQCELYVFWCLPDRSLATLLDLTNHCKFDRELVTKSGCPLADKLWGDHGGEQQGVGAIIHSRGMEQPPVSISSHS